MRRRAVLARAVLAVVAVVVSSGAGCASRPDPDIGEAQRVFVVTLPGLGWDDVSSATMPNLLELAQRSAVGNLANRLGRGFADLPSAYLTMGAGTRAVAGVPETGVALGQGETVNGQDLTELLGRRTDPLPPGGLAYLAAGPTADVNRLTVFGADVGMLGDHLATAGVHRGVVANGDEIDELQGFGSATITTELHREATAMLMGSDGIVPSGEVSQDLLERDPAGPLGVRYDVPSALAAAAAAADEAGERRSVVLVEASDLARFARSRSQLSPDQASEMGRRMLRDADELLAGVVDLADRPGDAVLVLGVPTVAARPALGLALLHSETADGGFLRSPTTGRDGYVQLADVGPTLLQLLAIDPPTSVEGRPVMLSPRPAGALGALADDIDEAEFRDEVLPAVTAAFILANAALLGLALWRRRRGGHGSGRPERWVRLLAFTIVGTATATFLVGAEALTTTSPAGYALLVVGVGLVLGLVAAAVELLRPGLGSLVALGMLVAVVAADVLAGASLQVNTSFGYSVAVAGRFTGLGNLAFSLFGAASLLLAVLAAQRWGARGLVAAGAVLAAALLVDGFPLLGADVGGTLTLGPAFALAGAALSGVRLRPVHVVLAGLLGLLVTLAFAAVDLARPDHLQTHLARFARLLLDQEWAVLADSLGRRLQASFGGVETAAWLAVLALAAGTVTYIRLIDRGRQPLRLLRRDWSPAAIAAGVGLGVLGAIGWVANDSSIAVPATMMIVVVPVLVDRVVLPAGPEREA
jgi:hypothetical protein